MKKELLCLLAGALLLLAGPVYAAKADICRPDENGSSCSTNAPCPAIIERSEYKTELFDVEYPRVCGMSDVEAQGKINDVLKMRVEQFIAQVNQAAEDGRKYPLASKFSAKMDFQIHRQDADLLSITLRTYQFTGGAHGSSSLEGYTFKLATGQILKYSELFNFDFASRQSLNEKIAVQIRERQIPIFEPFGGVSDNPGFYLKDGRKAVIVFQQYEIAPYSSGILEFEIDY